MKKRRIKPYYSYYHYKKKKQRIKRIGGIGFLIAMILFVIFATNKITSKKESSIVQQVSVLNEDVYLQSDTRMYGVFLEPHQVKGIYVPANKANKIEQLLEDIQDTQVNSFVIDIKDDYGYLTFASENKVLKEMGAIKEKPPIQDLKKVMDALYNQGVYPIARIVAFKDDVVGLKDPQRVICNSEGQPYVNKDGQMWLDPYNKENWDYLLEVCKDAIYYGFKEIQFDYVRFHESMNDETVVLPKNVSRTKIITEFVSFMSQELQPYGVYVSVDVFGTIITSSIDAEIVGQDYKELSKVLDYIYPMIYPSHYGQGSFGVPYPDLAPYDIILGALQASNRVVKEVPRSERKAKIRPWLQDFTATWVEPHQFYGEEQIQEQIQGAKDALIEEFILWNGAAVYTLEALNIE